MIKIKPQPNIVYIKTEEAHAGILDTSSRESAVEYAEVLDVGEDVDLIKKGDHIFYKSWAVDSVFHQDKRYNFINVKTGGILAVVK